MKHHMPGLLRLASASFFIALSSAALAQNSGAVTNHALPIGKGPGVAGFGSLLLGSGQIPMGQSSADPTAVTPSGDVTINTTGVTAIGANKVTNAQLRTSGALALIGRSANSNGNVADIQATAGSSCVFEENASTIICGQLATAGLANNAVTNAKLATAADSTIKSNISGSTGNDSDNTITAILDKQFGTTRGTIVYRGASAWQALAPGTAGQFLTTQSTTADPNWSGGGAGTGTVTQVVCGTGLSGGTITASGTCALALTNATLQASPTNPTGTTSTTGAMMGLGATCHITPVYSGRIKLEIIGDISNNSAGNGVQTAIKYGTGTAPINGAAFSGTQIGNILSAQNAGTSNPLPFANGGIITGLSTGTAYWFDIDVVVGAGTGSVLNLSCNAFEF